jgi:hypothetical protein
MWTILFLRYFIAAWTGKLRISGIDQSAFVDVALSAMTLIDFEPAPPANADWVGDWAEDDGLCRYYCEPEHVGVKVVGFQNFDGSERPRKIYIRGDRELSAEDARALAQALLDAADRLA